MLSIYHFSKGAGTAEGWVLPLSHLMGDLHAINITQCNSVVQNLIQFLGDSCVPNALQSAFNPFGDNTQEICRLCSDVGTQAYCTSRDRLILLLVMGGSPVGSTNCSAPRNNSGERINNYSSNTYPHF